MRSIVLTNTSFCDGTDLKQVMKLRQTRFRALITLDPATPSRGTPMPAAAVPPQYPNHTRALMVRALRPRIPGTIRYFAAEICWDGDEPLHPGDHAIVTITLTDDEAVAYLEGGQRFTLWSGGDVGHGTISRRVFTEHGPS